MLALLTIIIVIVYITVEVFFIVKAIKTPREPKDEASKKAGFITGAIFWGSFAGVFTVALSIGLIRKILKS